MQQRRRIVSEGCTSAVAGLIDKAPLINPFKNTEDMTPPALDLEDVSQHFRMLANILIALEEARLKKWLTFLPQDDTQEMVQARSKIV